MKNTLHLARSSITACLLLLGLSLLSCQSQVAHEATTAAKETPAPTVAESTPMPAAGPLDPDRPTEAGKPAVPPPTAGSPPKDLHHKTLQNPDGTWGYDIIGDGKLLLHQPHIPALPGNAGFQTEAQATRVAQAAIQKIKQGESLPTLSVEEVRGLMAN